MTINYECSVSSVEITESGNVHVNYILNGPGFDVDSPNSLVWDSESQILGAAGLIITSHPELRGYLATAYAETGGALVGKPIKIKIDVKVG